MRLAMITDNDSLNIFEAMQDRLLSEIADLEIETFILPFKNDLPFKAAESSEAFDLIFVFTSFEKENFEVQVVLQKLIDIELKTGTKIVKGFQQLSLEDLEEPLELEQEKKRLADKWSEILLTYFFTEDTEKKA